MYSKINPYVRVLALVVVSAVSSSSTWAETQSLETLLAYLKSPIASTRGDAAHKLGERRIRTQIVVEALTVAARTDDDPGVRAEAVHALGLIKDFSALPEMLEALRDSHIVVRRAAVKALVSLYTEHDIDFITNHRAGWNTVNPFLDTDDHEIIEPYIVVNRSIISGLGEAARGDREREIRAAAIRAIGVLRGRDAIPHLADAMNADQELRLEVLRAFIKIGDPTAGPYLIPFFRDSNRKVRTQAMVAAGMLKFRPAVQPLLSVYGLGPEKRTGVVKVAAKVKGLVVDDTPRDEGALWALALIGDERAEQVFVENISDSDSDRRRYAFEGLARIAEPRYSDQVSRLILTEKDTDVKLAENWALYRMGSKANLQAVVRTLDSYQQEQARGYLMEVASPDDLYPYVHASNKTVRRSVIEILGRIGSRATIQELEPVARSSGSGTADAATVAIKRIEWRLSGRPSADGEVMRRDTRPRRSDNNR